MTYGFELVPFCANDVALAVMGVGVGTGEKLVLESVDVLPVSVPLSVGVEPLSVPVLAEMVAESLGSAVEPLNVPPGLATVESPAVTVSVVEVYTVTVYPALVTVTIGPVAVVYLGLQVLGKTYETIVRVDMAAVVGEQETPKLVTVETPYMVVVAYGCIVASEPFPAATVTVALPPAM